jgi:hypothetical protein
MIWERQLAAFVRRYQANRMLNAALLICSGLPNDRRPRITMRAEPAAARNPGRATATG